MSASASAGYLQLLCEVAERDYQVGHEERCRVELVVTEKGARNELRSDDGNRVSPYFP